MVLKENLNIIKDGFIEELDEINASLINLTKEIEWKLIMNFLKKSNLSRFYEMGIVYMFSIFEAFLKSYFFTLYREKPYLMKSKKKVKYEVILKHDTMKSLIDNLAHNQTDQFGYMSLDDLNNFFKKRFKIDLKKNSSIWNGLHENYMRRNLIVHNYGKFSEEYFLSLGVLPKFLKGAKMPITSDYLDRCNTRLVNLIERINSSILENLNIN
ncbi:MAG: hypothetical protein P8Y97_03030 [Candidatus Lokiarchaeota archaeon]